MKVYESSHGVRDLDETGFLLSFLILVHFFHLEYRTMRLAKQRNYLVVMNGSNGNLYNISFLHVGLQSFSLKANCQYNFPDLLDRLMLMLATKLTAWKMGWVSEEVQNLLTLA